MTNAVFSANLMKRLLAGTLLAAPLAAIAQAPQQPAYNLNTQAPQQPYYDLNTQALQQPYYTLNPQGEQQPSAGQQGNAKPADPGAQAYDQGYRDGQLSVVQAPPELPQEVQPESPGDGYIWTPGYWAYGPSGYRWLTGSWVEAPYAGALWTPGYWGFDNGFYGWNAGYWGTSIGYYGGLNYGFGYYGTGFYGGYWNGGRFFYNRYYSHVGAFNHNVYGQQFSGLGGVHPGGRSYAPYNAGHGPGNFGARPGGTFNGRSGNVGRPGQNNGAATSNFYHGTQGPARQSFNNGGNTLAPRQSLGSATAPRQNYVQPAAPRQNYAAPAAPRQNFSAPASNAPRSAPAPAGPSGGGFHGSTGGGGSHSSGHR